MKLIDKDAVLVDIERLKDSVPYFPTIAEKEAYKEGVDSACCKVESLEVKEVDLEKEYKDFLKCDDGRSMFETAKHFFELGLNASNPLTWRDIEMIGKLRLKVALDLRNKELESSIKNPIKFTEEDLCKEVLKRFKEQKEK